MLVFRRICRFLTGLGFALLCAARPAACASVQDIRLGAQDGSNVRVVIDLSENVAFKTFALTNPDRVVIDLPSADFAVKERDLPKKDYLSGVRLGKTDPKTARVVFEFNRGVAIKRSFTLAPQSGFQWRLVVDLELMAKTDGLKLVRTY